MEIKSGCIVRAISGRDKGTFFLTVEVSGNSAYIVDGKTRKIAKQKRKNIKHLTLTKMEVDVSEYKTDKSIRVLLHNLNYPDKN